MLVTILAIVATVIALIFIKAYRYAHKFRGIFKDMGVKQLPGKPFLGNWELYMNAKDLFKLERDMIAEHGKVFGYFEGRVPTLMVADPELLKQVLIKDHEHFVDRRVLLTGRKKVTDYALTGLTGERWKHVRQQITPAFTPANLRRMEPLIGKVIDQLAANFGKKADSGEDIDIKDHFGYFTMDAISTVAFALEIDSLNQTDHPFVTYAKMAFRSVGLNSKLASLIMVFPDFFAKIMGALPIGKKIKEIDNFYANVVVQEIARRQSQEIGKVQRSDFLAMLIPLERDPKDPANEYAKAIDELGCVWLKNGLIREEIIAQSVIFFLAGYETTSTTLSLVLLALCEHPEIQQRLYDEIKGSYVDTASMTMESLNELKYLQMVIDETMRFYTPTLRTNRVCTSETVINGLKIPKGLVINIPLNAIHHDPELWDDPDRFDPERFSDDNKGSIPPMAFLPFGGGNRNCIGMRLAYLEMKMALARLVFEFKFTLSPKIKLPVEWKPVTSRQPIETLYVRAERR